MAHAPRGTGKTEHSVGGIGVGQMNVVQFVSTTESLGFDGNDRKLRFEIAYSDVAGQSYTTTTEFHVGPNAYRTSHHVA